MIFHDCTITLVGNRHSTRTHDSADLTPAAVEVFRSMFEQHGDHFRRPLPVPGLEWLELAFDSESEALPWARSGKGRSRSRQAPWRRAWKPRRTGKCYGESNR